MSAAPRLITANRSQVILATVDVEKLIADDHPARAIWEFVGRLDLEPYQLAIKSVEGSAGRPSYDPRLLVSIWILATSMGEGSAREIERLCSFHPAYQWLTGMDEINHHTLSDFRVDYREKLDELFTQVLGLLSAENLITLKRITQDGTKIKACASLKSFRGEEK
ncbi:MAG: IS5/IS1182 family transposase, partial [Elusimicrobia bacterium CG11_big_fil_rev_8_21_14_0_20_64_6]